MMPIHQGASRNRREMIQFINYLITQNCEEKSNESNIPLQLMGELCFSSDKHKYWKFFTTPIVIELYYK